jgi:hypothetical protein
MRITNTREAHMSWFKKAPVKNPPKPKPQVPHRITPATQKHMDEVKKKGPEKSGK